MKVLFIVTAYARSDDDVITPWLRQTIKRLGARGVTVEVLAPSYRGLPDQVIEGVRVHRFRYAPAAWETLTHDQTAPDRIRQQPVFAALLPGYLLAGSVAAARLVRSGGFAAVHTFWPLPHGLMGLAAKRSARIPLISTFFGVELTWVASQLTVMRGTLRRIIRHSDVVTAISNHTAGLIQKLVPEVTPVVIPFGAAIEPSEGLSSPPPRAGTQLLFVGRLVERKGVHVLLEAMGSVDPAVTLTIIGGGPERERLEAQAAELGLEDRVQFKGFVSESELKDHLRSCDVLVLPAVEDAKGDVEGLGVVLLEAMSFGKPVIASASGGIVDIVRSGENGLLVQPGDTTALANAIDALFADPARRLRMGERALRDVKDRFSWNAIIDALVEVYDSVANRPVS